MVEFDVEKIENAIHKAMSEVGRVDNERLKEVVEKITSQMENNINVERIQDLVIKELYRFDFDEVAKAYSEYRHEQNRARKTNKKKYTFLSDEFLSKYKHMSDPFPTELGKVVYYRTYSRPIPEEGRREYWWETVARVVEFTCGLQPNHLLPNEAEESLRLNV